MNRGRILRALCAGLRGELDPATDWMALIGAANRAFVTPSLCASLEASGALSRAPEDAVAFLQEVRARSQERNRRLRTMVVEAAAALNRVGVEPVLLKGMAAWATCGPDQPFERMMSDVDLLVRPAEAGQALAALREAGFAVLSQQEGPAVHVVAELGRPQDVGLIDLHQRPPGPPAMAAIPDLARAPLFTAWGPRLRLPSPTLQVYFLCLHDQMHDGDFWRGGFDLRHLLDIAALAQSPQIDWLMLDALIPTRLLRNAICAQLTAARRLAGAKIPERFAGAWVSQLHHRRHMAQHLHPRWALPLAAFGAALEAGNLASHRAKNRAGRRRLLGAAAEERLGLGRRAERLRQIMTAGGGKF